MHGLSRQTMDRLADLSAEIEAVYEEMDAEVTSSADRLEALREKADAFRDEAFQHFDDAIGAAEDYFNDRSEKWQEGDKGQAYSTWKDWLETLRDNLDSLPDIEPAVINRPDFLDDLNAADFERPDEF